MIYSCTHALDSGKTLQNHKDACSWFWYHHFLCSLYPCKILPLVWRKRSMLFQKITFYVVFNAPVWI